MSELSPNQWTNVRGLCLAQPTGSTGKFSQEYFPLPQIYLRPCLVEQPQNSRLPPVKHFRSLGTSKQSNRGAIDVFVLWISLRLVLCIYILVKSGDLHMSLQGRILLLRVFESLPFEFLFPFTGTSSMMLYPHETRTCVLGHKGQDVFPTVKLYSYYIDYILSV